MVLGLVGVGRDSSLKAGVLAASDVEASLHVTEPFLTVELAAFRLADASSCKEITSTS